MSPRLAAPRSDPYAQAVPAVRRAMAALERLAAAPDGLGLADLSRALGVSPSSMLAILRTLERQGYVAQDAASRRYRVGLPLVALARRAAQGQGPEAVFQRLGGRLAERLGETISLWALHGGEAVLIAAEEGPRQARFAPRPGLRWPAVGSAVGQALLGGLGQAQLARWHAQAALEMGAGLPTLSELAERCSAVRVAGYADEYGATEPGLYLLAVPVPGVWRGIPLAVAYAAPRPAPAADGAGLVARGLRELARLLAEAIQGPGAGGETLAPAAGRGRAVWLPALAGPMPAAELKRFLDGPWLATLGCVKGSGYPHTVPVWYEWDGRAFWVVANGRAEWAAHLRRNPQASLTISEPVPPLRRVLVEGHAEQVDSPDGRQAWGIRRRMARRYLGAEAPAYLRATHGLPRWLFRIVPEKMVTWRGLASHPRYYEAEAAPPATDEARRARA